MIFPKKLLKITSVGSEDCPVRHQEINPFKKSSLSFSNSNGGLEIAHADNMTARESLENADFHLLISH